MKTLLFIIISLVTTTTFAQQKVTWEGGTPGNENNWNEARNWSTNYVPNEFSDVYIPNVSFTTFSDPIIEKGEFEVNSLQIESNAQLTIKATANLVIYFEEACLFNGEVIKEGVFGQMSDITESK